MKKLLTLVIALLSVTTIYAQYGVMTPRSDYRQAFSTARQTISWSRESDTEKNRSEIYSDIASRITITTIVENMIIGTIEVDLGAKASFSQSRLPWDDSLFKANVIYELRDNSYKVTVSNILHKHHTDKEYSSIHSIIFNNSGQLRARGDGDLQYFDNAFCDLLLIE